MRALTRARGSFRLLLLVACGLAVVIAVHAVIAHEREQADRARRAQVLMERVRSSTQQVEIITLRTRVANDKAVARSVKAGFDNYRRVVADVRALREMDVPHARFEEVDRDVGRAYGIGINALALLHGNPQAGRQVALTTFSRALADVADATALAARRQDAVARAALLRAGIATTGSLALGALLLVLLGWRMHRLQRGSALAEQARAVERRGEERLRALVRHSSDVVAVTDASWHLRWLADSVRGMLGFEPAALIGRALTELVHPDDAGTAERFLRDAIGDGEGVRMASLRLRGSDGRYRHLELVADNRLADPLIDGILLNVRDVSERHALLERLHHQAFHDALTGLANRALLEDRVTQALARSRRSGTTTAAIFLDLDDFKAVNDGLGHAAGDELLRIVAARLQETLRGHDTPARLGGDEFAVLLEELVDDAEAAAIAERLRAAIERPLTVAGRSLTPAASLGVACASPTDTHETLLRNADVAMYAAKHRGKGRVAAFERAMRREALERLDLADDA
jgi:diguanylate cyclase (GGDEF)-like protein/PAS domain S-box-containing protein